MKNVLLGFAVFFFLHVLITLAACSSSSQNDAASNTDGNVNGFVTNSRPEYWMTVNWSLIRKLTLQDLVLPGSHDSGMSKARDCTLIPPTGECHTRTQDLSVGEQLHSGIRYFDLRLAYYFWKRDFRAVHIAHASHVPVLGTGGCMGESLEEVLDAVASFADEHPREVIILKLSHFYEAWKEVLPFDLAGPMHFEEVSNSDACKHHYYPWLISFVNYHLHKHLVQFPIFRGHAGWGLTDAPLWIITADYPKAAGRPGNIIVTIDGLDTCQEVASEYGNPFADSVRVFAQSDLNLIDSYSESNDPGKMADDQWRKMLAERKQGQLFVLSWTLTQGPWDAIFLCPWRSAVNLGIEANGAFPELFLAPYLDGLSDGSPEKDRMKANRPNVIYMDVVNEQVTQWTQEINTALYPAMP